MKTPYFYFYNGDDGARRAVWALRLESCPAWRVAQYATEANGARRAGQNELLRALVAGRATGIGAVSLPPLVYALRYIFRPDAARPANGHIEVVLLGQMTVPAATKESNASLSLFKETVALLGGALPDHIWQAVSDTDEFKSLWQPFDVGTAHVAAVRRPESVLRLPIPSNRPTLGNTGVSLETTDSPVVLVHPFVPQLGRVGYLLRTFLLHSTPLVWQTTVSPAQLSSEETAALHSQIARCEQPEHHRQSNRNAHFAPTPDLPERLAKDAGNALGEQLMRLQNAPLLLSVALWSPKPVPATLAAACGAATTTSDFDVKFPEGKAELESARRDLLNLEYSRWGETQLPPALQRLTYLAGVEEAGAVLLWPQAEADGLPGVTVSGARLRPVPRAVAQLAQRSTNAAAGLTLGINRHLGGEQEIFLTESDRRQHMYIVGQTGTGKTTFIKNMVQADMNAGHGLAVIDPHGDLFEELLDLVPEHRRDDVVLIDPSDMENPVGLNMLEFRDEQDRYFIVREMCGIMERLLRDQYKHEAHKISGPIFYQHLQMNLLLTMSDAAAPGTLLEFYEIFQHPQYWKRWLPLQMNDVRLRHWIEQKLPTTDYHFRGRESVVTLGEHICSKFEDFLFDPRLRLIFGQKRSTINLRTIMDEGKILFVNLAKGQLTEANARFLGMVLMAKLQTAAMSRIELPAAERRPFYLYVDEFQSLATQNFSLLLSEARKFGLGLTLANQFAAQIKDTDIAEAIFGNVGTVVSFRVGNADAQLLAPLFQPHFDAVDLTNLPNWQACLKTTVHGQVVPPFTLQTKLSGTTCRAVDKAELRALSAKRYGVPRQRVEDQIARGFKLKRTFIPV